MVAINNKLVHKIILLLSLADLKTGNWLGIDESGYHEKPSAVDAARKAADYVHISAT